MNLNDLTLLTVSFNNNLLTGMMIKSFFKQVGLVKVVIVDNGTSIAIGDSFKRVFTVVDNMHQKITGDYRQCSKNHCSTIDYALKHLIMTDWVLLVDNDILFKPQTKEFLKLFDCAKYDCAGEIGWDDAPPARLFPYFCLINVRKFNDTKLSYFDDNRCIGPGSKEDGPRGINTSCWYKDTGCSFYEDIKDIWAINEIKLTSYIAHMKCTGEGNRDIAGFLKQNQMLWE